MESSYDVIQNQLHIINSLIKRLIESQGLGTELNTNEPTAVSSENKSKILSMLKVREKLQGRLPKQQSKQDKNLELLVGNFYYFDNQYAKAISSYDKLLKADPNNLNSLINKGIATSKLGNHKDAITLYDKVLEIDPNYFDALHCKGDSLTLLSKHDEALSCYDQTLEIDPNYFDGLYKKGLALLNLHHYKEAIFHFDKALSIEPNHTPSLINKGIATSKLGNHKDAITLYDKVLESDPHVFEAMFNKGLALTAIKKYDDALACFDKSLETDPHHTDVLFNKGFCLANLGKHQIAISYYDKSLEFNPRHSLALYHKGFSLLKLGKNAEALECLDKVIQIDSGFEEAILRKGQVLLSLRDFEQAIQYFDKILEKNPSNLTSLYGKAVCLSSLGIHDLAISFYDKTLEISPNHFDAICNKGRTLSLLGYDEEALEHVETINETLLKLEEEPDKKEHLDLIFRSAHTIKGMSATMGYDDTRELCKNIENIFDNIRKGQEKIAPNLASALFKCIDLLREMIADEKKKVDLKPYLQMLEHPDDTQVDVVEPTSSTKSPTIRVKMLDLDSLVNLVGELVISKMRLEQTLSHNGSDEARQVMTELDRLVTDLQYQSMKLRLVPIDQIFSRFTRLVRDTSTGLGKQVNLTMDGSGIELDRTVLDAITDPLLHILRNCVDHGIETPQERELNEKSPTGTIKLTAYGVGDQVAIKIEDDGKGIDIDKLKAKAVEKKLITQDEAFKMSTDEAINLLGTPGLSTAKEITDVSGRGVGMDVVITQVEAVGGNVKITTEKGKGTVIILTIPLSVSIIGGLLINVSGDKYVLPLSSISTTVVVEANQIKSIHGQEAVVLREQVVPLVRVSKLLGMQETEPGNTDKITIVIVNKGGKPYGLIVDSYDRKQEIVIKRLSNETHSSDLFTNATILGDGSVALILDPALLV